MDERMAALLMAAAAVAINALVFGVIGWFLWHLVATATGH